MVTLVEDYVVKCVLVKKLKRVCHCDVCRKHKVCVKLLVILVVNTIAPIAAKYLLKCLKGLHQNRSFMNYVQKSLRIKVERVKSSQKCLTRSRRRNCERLCRSHRADTIELFQCSPLHIIGLVLRIGDIIIHVPSLDGIVQPGLVLINQVSVQRKCALPECVKLLFRISKGLRLLPINDRHIPLNIFEQRIHSDVG